MGHHHDDDDDAEFEDEHQHSGRFLTGVLLGGLLGVGAGLLLAPAAGQATRQKLRDRATFARDQAVQAAEDARAKAEDIQNTGREMLEENKRRIVRTAEAVKHSAQEAWASESNSEPANPAPIAPEQGSRTYNLMGQTGKNSSGASTSKPAAH
jgi:gas vesicle protein